MPNFCPTLKLNLANGRKYKIKGEITSMEKNPYNEGYDASALSQPLQFGISYLMFMSKHHPLWWSHGAVLWCLLSARSFT